MASRKKTKKKRKKRHYHTGVYSSPKCKNSPIKYRSGWELAVCKFLDYDENVEYYEYEPFFIEYVSNNSTGKKRKYFPDFFIKYRNDVQKLIEVKRLKQITNRIVLKKAAAAELWAKEHKTTYEIWTESQIKPIMKIVDSIE